MAKHLVLISSAVQTCGVEEFARLLASKLGADGRTQILGKGVAPAEDVILNLPVVAWKHRLIAPILAALRARVRGSAVTIILHEWADLALARRVSYWPLLPLASRILFSSPEVEAQFESTPVSSVATRTRGLLPIPPNFTIPTQVQQSAQSRSLASDRAGGAFILAQFGSIYPKKDPNAVLDAVAELVRRDLAVRMVFVGSFVGEGVAAEFWRAVDERGLRDRVTVTGYVQSAAELYGILAEIDAFLYPLAEGLTSRRASVLAAALSGKPVIVTAPRRADSLAHHRLFGSLIEAGAIRFVPLDGDAAILADAVLATRGAKAITIDASDEIDAVWADVVAAINSGGAR